MKRIHLKHLSLFILLLSPVAFANNSLTWQKLSLEEKIHRKYDKIISSSLKENQYMIEVEAEVSDPGAPNFGNDKNETGPKVSDITLEESRGDYIAFSKVGLEMPVIDKFLDEDRTKLMNLYRFNESYDLFKNLAEIKVTVFLSDKIPKPLQDIVQQMVKNSKFNVSGMKPSVKFDIIPMEWVEPKKEVAANANANAKKDTATEKPKAEVEPKIWAKDWFEWASRWGNAVGLILGSLIIGIMAFILFQKWQEFMQQVTAKNRQENEGSKDKEEDKDKLDLGQGDLPGGVPSQEDEVAIAQGFLRFQQCLAQHHDEAVNLVKSWLNEGDLQTYRALRAVAQQANREEMELVLNDLSNAQRDKWKALLSEHLKADEIAEANKFIFQEVVKSLLAPSIIKDSELVNLIMEMNSQRTIAFLESNKVQVGVMMNVLSPSLISKILMEVDEKRADAWLTEGAVFNFGDFDGYLSNLKTALITFKINNETSPFAQRIMAMIPSAQPSREKNLFRALAKAGGAAMVLETARKHFPTELINELPPIIIKDVMLTFPVARRIDILYSMDESSRTPILNAMAEPGSTARDMMDMELENIKFDLSRKAIVESRREEIWTEFVKVTRLSVLKNPSYGAMLEDLIKEWCRKLAGLKAIPGGKAA
jgi:uncharacterized protein (DUF305 family)